MGEEFLKKKGIVINFLASDLLQLKKGDRVPSVANIRLASMLREGRSKMR